MSLVASVVSRIGALALTALAASFLLFIAIQVLPGSAAQATLGFDATPQAVARFEAQHGLDRPWLVQYGDWLGHSLRGDLGVSFQGGVDLGADLAARIPVTLELALLAFLVANLIAVPLALAGAQAQRRWGDHAVRVIGAAIGSMPSFWLATVLVLVLTLRAGWLPPSGYVPFLRDPAANLQHMVMPALALGIASAGLLLRILRAALLEAMRGNYVTTAAAKGMSRGRVLFRHVLRNALNGYLHVATLELGFLFGGVVVIEDIFRLPGVGSLVLTGIINRDYPMLLAGAVTVTLFVLLANAVIDGATALLDPRRSQVTR